MSAAESDAGHVDFTAGLVYPELTVLRTRDYQSSRLRACLIDPARYGTQVEVGLYGQDCFKMIAAAGHRMDGIVHMGQRFIKHRPVAIGEPLVQRGRVDALTPHHRGTRVDSTYEFIGRDGAAAVTAALIRLLPDPAKMGKPGTSRADPVDPRDGLEQVAAKTMRPEDVTLFSGDVGNLIHFDPEFARRYGYRAPIAQGIQTAVWVLSSLAEQAPPRSFDVAFQFLRPVYWDEAVTLWVRRGPDGIALARALNADGKVTTEMTVAAAAW